MLAWIYVADSPYYALTGEDGSFSLTDVPPGDYTLVTWQEHVEETEMPVTVKAGEIAEVTIELKNCRGGPARRLTPRLHTRPSGEAQPNVRGACAPSKGDAQRHVQT